jgi:helicase
MRLIDAGTTGQGAATAHPIPRLPAPWDAVLRILAPSGSLRPVQAQHLGPVLDGLANLIVQAPTNAGKSMVGLLACLKAIQAGQRAVLLVPLKAIAQEQAEQIQALQASLGTALGCDLQVRVTTGDYQLTDEFFADPPPKTGRLIIATPERLEVILRNPDHDTWVNTIGCVCVDEAHLLGESKRGPGLETTLTHMLGLTSPPRIVLLSATLGDTTSLAAWLRAALPIPAPPRTPPLCMQVGVVAKDAKESSLIEYCRTILSSVGTSVLVFVSTVARAAKLARTLATELGPMLIGPSGCEGFHAQRSAADKVAIRAAIANGSSRLVVATTALAMGVNLPTTHVIIADATRRDGDEASSIPTNEVIQMCGRAGRGTRSGQALVLLSDVDLVDVDADTLAGQLRTQRALNLTSPFAGLVGANRHARTRIVADRIGALLTRYPDGVKPDDIRSHFARSWGGTHLAPMVDDSIRFLESCFGHHQFDGQQKPVGLAWRTEQGYCKLTHLGMTACRAAAPMSFTVGIAHLLRDLMEPTVDPEDALLRHAAPIDLLVLVELRREKPWKLGKLNLSAKLHQQVNQQMTSAHGGPSQLFAKYILTESLDTLESSNADAVLGSLFPNGEERPTGDQAVKSAYLAAFRALVLNDLLHGRPPEDIATQYEISNLDGVQEQWRDSTQWLLMALMPCLDHKAYLHHLKKVHGAGEEREMVIAGAFQRLRAHTYDLLDGLKYCSPLGDFLRELREGRTGTGRQVAGPGTIAKLEAAGITSRGKLLARFPQVRGDPDENPAAQADLQVLTSLVGRKAYALQIRATLRRQV